MNQRMPSLFIAERWGEAVSIYIYSRMCCFFQSCSSSCCGIGHCSKFRGGPKSGTSRISKFRINKKHHVFFHPVGDISSSFRAISRGSNDSNGHFEALLIQITFVRRGVFFTKVAMSGHGWTTSHEGFNYIISPENRWLEDDPVLLGPGNFSGAILKLRGCTFQEAQLM